MLTTVENSNSNNSNRNEFNLLNIETEKCAFFRKIFVKNYFRFFTRIMFFDLYSDQKSVSQQRRRCSTVIIFQSNSNNTNGTLCINSGIKKKKKKIRL